jgi:hypothetical protein
MVDNITNCYIRIGLSTYEDLGIAGIPHPPHDDGSNGWPNIIL